MNHPAIDVGYKAECDGKILFFTGDHEPLYTIYEPGEVVHAGILNGVGILIADAQYTEAEYAVHKGWGHDSHERVLGMTDIGRVLTHHGSARTDREPAEVEQRLIRDWDDRFFQMVREGDMFDV